MSLGISTVIKDATQAQHMAATKRFLASGGRIRQFDSFNRHVGNITKTGRRPVLIKEFQITSPTGVIVCSQPTRPEAQKVADRYNRLSCSKNYTVSRVSVDATKATKINQVHAHRFVFLGKKSNAA